MTKLFPEYEQAIDDLLQEGIEYGRVITHEWLDKHLELDVSSPNYGFDKLSRFENFRNRLVEKYKIHLKNVKGEGYRILPPEEQTVSAVKETFKSISRTVRKGIFYLSNVDTTKLSSEQKKENTDALVRMSGLKGMVKKEKNLLLSDG